MSRALENFRDVRRSPAGSQWPCLRAHVAENAARELEALVPRLEAMVRGTDLIRPKRERFAWR